MAVNKVRKWIRSCGVTLKDSYLKGFKVQLVTFDMLILSGLWRDFCCLNNHSFDIVIGVSGLKTARFCRYLVILHQE